MALFGGSIHRGLVDTRTEEERQREISELFNPLGPKRPVTMPEGLPTAAPTMPDKPAGGLLGGGWSDRLSNLASGLGAAAAFSSGDFGAGASILNHGARMRQDAAKKQSDEQMQAQMLAGLKAQGLTDEQAMLVLNNAANIGDFRPKAPEVPSFVKNLEAWNQMTDEQKRQVAQMMSVLNPTFMTGQDGLPYQRPPAQVPSPAPWQANPDEWEMVPDEGGAGQQAPRPFRPQFLAR